MEGRLKGEGEEKRYITNETRQAGERVGRGGKKIREKR